MDTVKLEFTQLELGCLREALIYHIEDIEGDTSEENKIRYPKYYTSAVAQLKVAQKLLKTLTQ